MVVWSSRARYDSKSGKRSTRGLFLTETQDKQACLLEEVHEHGGIITGESEKPAPHSFQWRMLGYAVPVTLLPPTAILVLPPTASYSSTCLFLPHS